MTPIPSFIPADTHPEAARVQLAVYRRMSGEQRLEIALQMSDSVRRLVADGVRYRHPEWSEEQVQREVVRLMLAEGRVFSPNYTEPRGQAMAQEEFLAQIAAHLEACGIPFMVTGSLGSSYHGRPRTTQDVDIVIDPNEEQLTRFLAHLGDRYYVSPEAARDALHARTMFNLIDSAAGWKADLIVRKDRPYSREEFQRRRTVPLHGQMLPVVTSEDLILAKLEWDKITASERQLTDALYVAIAQWPRLDQAYLRKWAPVLGVTERLEALLQQAEQSQTS